MTASQCRLPFDFIGQKMQYSVGVTNSACRASNRFNERVKSRLVTRRPAFMAQQSEDGEQARSYRYRSNCCVLVADVGALAREINGGFEIDKKRAKTSYKIDRWHKFEVRMNTFFSHV